MKKCYNSFIRQFNDFKKAQVRCKVIEATLLYEIFVFCLQFTMVFGQKLDQNLIVPSFRLKFDDVTVTLSLIAL